MTQPLTQREKVALKPCPFCGEEVFADQEKSTFIVGCFRTKCGMEPYCTGDDLNEIAKQWNRRTALASGSGDHAELAKKVTEGQRLQKGPYTAKGPYRHDEIAALLAENAALRAERDDTVVMKIAAYARLDAEINDHTEAERKLDEAVGLLREWMGTWFVDADSRGENAIADDTRKFLSKEAERG